MIKFARAWGLSLLMLFAFVHSANATVRFGIAAEPYAPFTSKDASGKWVGWEIDLMNAVCAAMEEQCEIFELSWDGLIPALNAKFFDVIWTSMSITPERAQVIDFTDPYYYSPGVIIGSRDGDMDVTTEHIGKRCLGIQGGTIHVAAANAAYPNISLKFYQTQDEALQDLTAGRCDYVIADRIALQSFLDTPTGNSCCELKKILPDVPPSPGVGGGVRKGDTGLRAKLNKAIVMVMKSGAYDAITAKYFPFSIAPH